jgi:hypothetical protein
MTNLKTYKIIDLDFIENTYYLTFKKYCPNTDSWDIQGGNYYTYSEIKHLILNSTNKKKYMHYIQEFKPLQMELL